MSELPRGSTVRKDAGLYGYERALRRHGIEPIAGVGRSFTVRKVSFGVGVERTFPLNSPIFEQIEVVTRGDVRRAKLYYLRNLRGKAAKIKERREAMPSS